MGRHKIKDPIDRKQFSVRIEKVILADFHSTRVVMGHSVTDVVEGMLRKYIAEHKDEVEAVLRKQTLIDKLNDLTADEMTQVIGNLVKE